MRIACLALDSRPCNSIFPVQLAAHCGHECVVPAPDKTDFFKTPARFEDSREFLLTEAARADALVVAVDHLCFGSLIGSRNDACDAETALRQLALLRDIHKAHPSLPIHLVNVIMRASISTLSSADFAAYDAMTEYSVYSDKAERTGDPADRAKAEDALSRIPERVLTRYRTARARNHAVNTACIDLMKDGCADSLLLVQEDSQIYGFHKHEQRLLSDYIRKNAVPNVWIANGTDEACAAAVMRAITRNGKPLPVRVVSLPENGTDFVALYEDRPFRENLSTWLDYMGIVPDDGSDTVLAIATPPDGEQTDAGSDRTREEMLPYAQKIAALAETGRVYLLDLVLANGGSMSLCSLLAEQGTFPKLFGYAAWNTACNSLGTILAHLRSDLAAGHPNRAFFYERIADDLLYQGCLRQKLNPWVSAQGDDPHSLSDTEAVIRKLRELFDEFLKVPAFSFLPPPEITLPWARTFEIKAAIRD